MTTKQTTTEPKRIPIRDGGRLYGYYYPQTHSIEVKRGAAVVKIKLPPQEQTDR